MVPMWLIVWVILLVLFACLMLWLDDLWHLLGFLWIIMVLPQVLFWFAVLLFGLASDVLLLV
jgi:hypothetical protein